MRIFRENEGHHRFTCRRLISIKFSNVGLILTPIVSLSTSFYLTKSRGLKRDRLSTKLPCFCLISNTWYLRRVWKYLGFYAVIVGNSCQQLKKKIIIIKYRSENTLTLGPPHTYGLQLEIFPDKTLSASGLQPSQHYLPCCLVLHSVLAL